MKDEETAVGNHFILPPSSFILPKRLPSLDARGVRGGGEEFGDGRAERGVARVGDEVGQRGEDEASEVQTRVRERERVGVRDLAAVEQQVEVERARLKRSVAPTPGVVLDAE